MGFVRFLIMVAIITCIVTFFVSVISLATPSPPISDNTTNSPNSTDNRGNLLLAISMPVAIGGLYLMLKKFK